MTKFLDFFDEVTTKCFSNVFEILRSDVLDEIEIQQSNSFSGPEQSESSEQGNYDEVRSKIKDTFTFRKLHIENLTEQVYHFLQSLKVNKSEEILPLPADIVPKEFLDSIIQKCSFVDQAEDSEREVGEHNLQKQQEETQISSREAIQGQEINLESKESEEDSNLQEKGFSRNDSPEDKDKSGRTPSQNVPEEKEKSGSLRNLQNLIPRGVAIHPKTQHIFVADWNCKCIRIFDSCAEYIEDMELGDNVCPWGVALSSNNLYITDNRNNSAFRAEIKTPFHLTDLKYKLNSPRGIAVTANDRTLVIADCNNDRIVLYENGESTYLESYVLKRPVHVEIIERYLYIMCLCLKGKDRDERAREEKGREGEEREIYILKHQIGSKSYSEILRETGVNAFFFCFYQESFYISDMLAHCIKIYDSTGREKGKIPEDNKEGHNKGQLFYPSGVIVNKSSQIIIASSNRHNRIQQFDMVI